jgi:hypothetical protein
MSVPFCCQHVLLNRQQYLLLGQRQMKDGRSVPPIDHVVNTEVFCDFCLTSYREDAIMQHVLYCIYSASILMS